MKILLKKSISKLGIVGDIVHVKDGYARNYLLPQGLATEPTSTNVRALAEARKVAEQERAHDRKILEQASERLHEAEVTIRAKANEDGVLYGSVGRREVAIALCEEGHVVSADQVALRDPIRHLDNVSVDVKLADDLSAAVKVWVVREKTEEEEEAEKAEAATDGEGGEQ